MSIGKVVEHSTRSPQRGAAISRHVPSQAKTRREIVPFGVGAGGAGESGVSVKEDSRRGIIESSAWDSVLERILIKVNRTPIQVHHGQVRLPTEAVVQCESWHELPGIVGIDRQVFLPFVLPSRSTRQEIARMAG